MSTRERWASMQAEIRDLAERLRVAEADAAEMRRQRDDLLVFVRDVDRSMRLHDPGYASSRLAVRMGVFLENPR